MNTWKANRKTIIVICENCGNEFEKTLSEYNRSIKLERKHFCSLKCNNDNKKIKQKICYCCKNSFLMKVEENFVLNHVLPHIIIKIERVLNTICPRMELIR